VIVLYFISKFGCLNSTLIAKIVLEVRVNPCPPNVVSSVWMKTQSIMITPTIKFATNNYRMKSCCADSIPKSTHANSKSKSLKSTPTDSRVEFFVKFSEPELFLANSKLEFVAESKFPSSSLKRCLLVEFQHFSWFLSKFIKLKIIFSLIVPYTGFPMLRTRFFRLTMVFSLV